MNGLIGNVACVLATMVVIGGDFFLKLGASRGLPMASWPILLGCLLYGLSGIGWYVVLRHMTLGQMGVSFAVISLLATVLLGVVAFDEKLALRECLGIGLALGAMVAMSRMT